MRSKSLIQSVVCNQLVLSRHKPCYWSQRRTFSTDGKDSSQQQHLTLTIPSSETHVNSSTTAQTISKLNIPSSEIHVASSTTPQTIPKLPIDSFEPRGVFRDSEADDIKVLINNFTVPSLAMALRDRESTLQNAAILAESGNIDKLKDLLRPFLRENVEKRRTRNHVVDFSFAFSREELVIIQRYLHKMPRHVYQAAGSRASVVIPLCNASGIPSILFERRSSRVRTHKLQVCFPGGMLDEGVDKTIVQTSLREMEEELGIPKEKIEVLGILRCNWNEVASMTGIAVTPVVGFIGEINTLTLKPNSDEVEDYFTVSVQDVLDDRNWMSKNFSTPIFNGGPHAIWGLTAYLLDRFRRDILIKCTSVSP